MKKLYCLFLLVLVLALLIACGGETTTETTGADVTTTEPSLLPEGELVVKNNYTAVLNDAEWNPSSVDTSKYDIFGSGSDVYSQIYKTYSSYDISYVVVANGTETTYDRISAYNPMKALGTCGAELTIDEAAKTVSAKIVPANSEVLPAWKAVRAQAGSYVRFEFTASLPLKYRVTVTKGADNSQSQSVYTFEGITVSGEGSTYKGMGQVTVPQAEGETYYINISVDDAGSPTLASIPLYISAPRFTSDYQLVFKGEWTLVEDDRFMENLQYHFYTAFPRLYARWGAGTAPKEVTVICDPTYTGLAYKSGNKVVYSLSALNGGSPDTVGGSFTHELTHVVQCYNYSYSTRGQLIPGHENVKKHYFTENMANYGRHRYYAYGYSACYIEEKSLSSSYDWGYSEYGNAQLFWSWMDWVYPSKDLDGDGKVTTMEERGVIDYLVYMSKEYTGGKIDDDPFTPGTTFNNWVKEKTGFNTFDLLRQEFVRQAKAGEWSFSGFRDYTDNFITENITNLPNPEYPMHEKIEPTAKTNALLAAAVTTGDNLCKGANIHIVASQATENAYRAANMLDGDFNTSYQASYSTKLYKINGVLNEIVIDLGSVKTFDTYTLVLDDEKSGYIAKAWEILASADAVSYTALDYQSDNTTATLSVTVGDTSARFIKIRMFSPGTANKTRINEFMLFDLNQ